VTKEQPYSDVTRITWNLAGFNPKLYLVQPGDTLTIRGLATALNDQQLLNGSYQIIESGYDYVVVLNDKLQQTNITVSQPTADTFVFTSRTKITIYDSSEYGFASETDFNTATITVPAIPPLARRFLSGSAHLHGNEFEVIEFDQSSVKITLPNGIDKPVALNHFVIKNDRLMYDFRAPPYRTLSVDTATSPTYMLDASDPDASLFPATIPTPLGGVDPFHAEVGSDEITLTFPTKHGLLNGWEFTLSGVVGVSNLTSPIMNAGHVVSKKDTPFCIVFSVTNSLGEPVRFDGVPFGTFNVYRYGARLDDGSDFYLEFADVAAVLASGLVPGMTFKIDPDGAAILDSYYANQIRHKTLFVNSIDNNLVNVITGLGAGGPSGIMLNATGHRSTDFGGTNVASFFDRTSDWNVANVMSGLRLVMMDYTASQNPAYVGSYVFDPTGASTLYTVSRFVSRTTRGLLKGDNDGIIFVDSVTDVFGQEDFPKSGKILIDYGMDNVEGPIDYIAVIDNKSGDSQILIDPAYRIKNTHQVDAQVQYMHEASPYTPTQNGSDYPMYLTGTAQARNTLLTLIEEIIAGGVFLQTDVLLPELRYTDPAIAPFD
jgi:hypothetical protein